VLIPRSAHYPNDTASRPTPVSASQYVARLRLTGRWAPKDGFDPITIPAKADDHKAYYPGATPIHIRVTGDRRTGRLLGHHGAEIAKRIDTYATAISYHATVADIVDLDLSYTPPLGSPWDAVQVAATAWERQSSARGAVA
jgi:hypothetical protein